MWTLQRLCHRGNVKVSSATFNRHKELAFSLRFDISRATRNRISPFRKKADGCVRYVRNLLARYNWDGFGSIEGIILLWFYFCISKFSFWKKWDREACVIRMRRTIEIIVLGDLLSEIDHVMQKFHVPRDVAFSWFIDRRMEDNFSI